MYQHTEYFENTIIYDFEEELHDFFSKKITRFTKENNQIYKMLKKARYGDLMIEIINKKLNEENKHE